MSDSRFPIKFRACLFVVATAFLVFSLLGVNPDGARGKTPLSFRKLNVLLITVDCLRPDHMGLYGYSRDTTPNIDRFFKNAFRFNQAFSQASWTSPSVISLLTGLNPSVHGMDAKGKYFDDYFYTPLKQLRDEGYTVLGYDTGHNNANLGFNLPIKKGELIETLKKHRDDRFFIWYHYRGPHLPFAPPAPYRTAFNKDPRLKDEKAHRALTTNGKIPRGSISLSSEDARPIRDLYDGEVLYQDAELQKVFEFLATSGLLAETIVVLTADHGEELMEHGFIGHASTSLAATVFDEVIRIPLLIKVPGLEEGRTIERPAQQVHIMPTLFELLGLKARFASQGSSLLPAMLQPGPGLDDPVYIETSYCGWQCPKERMKERLFAVRSKKWKLVEERKSSGTTYSLYNLIEDPGETKNLVEKEKGVVEKYQRLLAKWQADNLELARVRAEEAAREHILRAENHINQKNFAPAVTELESVAHLHKVYDMENPSFMAAPESEKKWAELLARANALLAQARKKSQ